MEGIEFRYCFKDGDEVKEVNACKKAENGLHDSDVCRIFLDFMKSAGFSKESVLKHFKD